MKDRHDLAPVHTAAEMNHLHHLFPASIKLFTAVSKTDVLAGTIIYDYGNTIHTQYMYNSESGLECGALDLVIHEVINLYGTKKKYLSFGISTEDGGKVLNKGLQRQKEMFGGRSVLHNTYEITL